jgi:phosphocarrier protein HPr
VNIVNKYPYEIDLRSGRHVVDAKSILGIFSLDLSKPVIVEIYSDDCDDFLKDIESFIKSKFNHMQNLLISSDPSFQLFFGIRIYCASQISIAN